jgi:hypothetical protein
MSCTYNPQAKIRKTKAKMKETQSEKGDVDGHVCTCRLRHGDRITVKGETLVGMCIY